MQFLSKNVAAAKVRIKAQRLFSDLWQIFLRDRIVRPFVVPTCGGDPPARSVPIEFNAVHPAAFIGARVIREFVGRENMRNVAKPANDAIDLAFGKPVADERLIRRIHILLMI